MDKQLKAHIESIELLVQQRVHVKVWFEDKPNENLYFLLNLSIDEAKEFHVGQDVTIEIRPVPSAGAGT
jgi:hypothetical protein